MKSMSLKTLKTAASNGYLKAVVAAQVHLGKTVAPALFAAASATATSMLTSEPAQAQAGGPTGGGGSSGSLDSYNAQIVAQICNVIYMTQGGFGALVMSVAGLVAIVSAAVGSYRSALNAIAVGAGAYMVRPMIMLFFGNVPCGAVGINIPLFGGITITPG